ncbi:MAG: metal-dependent hydrolase [Bacillota bacterium]
MLLGSLLPDIIDKPLGGLVFKATLGNGRIYAHMLIFLLLLVGTGIFFWVKYKRPGVLVLAGGSFFHHILDGMWHFPGTYLWPFYGWSFPKGDPEG